MDQMKVAGVPATRRHYSMETATIACADHVAKP